jgi:hypothetical protein
VTIPLLNAHNSTSFYANHAQQHNTGRPCRSIIQLFCDSTGTVQFAVSWSACVRTWRSAQRTSSHIAGCASAQTMTAVRADLHPSCAVLCALGNMTCTLNVTNIGSISFSNVSVASTLGTPAETCEHSQLDAGTSYTCSITKTLSQVDFDGWTSGASNITVDVTATASTAEAPPVQVTETAQVVLAAEQTPPASSPEPTESPSPSPQPSPSPSPDPVQPEPPVYVADMMVALEDCSGPTEAGECCLSVNRNC